MVQKLLFQEVGINTVPWAQGVCCSTRLLCLKMKHVVVIVLGDLGRSPRMQYHAYSLASTDRPTRVSLIGYHGEATTSLISSCRNISEHRLSVWELPGIRRIPLLHALCKGIALVLAILFKLLYLPKYDLIVIQNPPSLPALLVAIFLSWFNGSEILLDWHNLGFAMFADKLGSNHILVEVARLLELNLVSFATKHICVSLKMKEWLATNFNVKATVLYDRPPRIFKERTLSVGDRHALLKKLGLSQSLLFPFHGLNVGDGEETIQTTSSGGRKPTTYALLPPPVQGSGKVALVVSCTSWTPDEDFGLLLDSLLEVEAQLVNRKSATKPKGGKGVGAFDRLVVVVTGKGPLRVGFEEAVQQHCEQGRLGRYVAVRTAWLDPGDYPALLRCADLGVSLHTSTSGIDLPMKVLDMFGSGVPVCAVAFPALSELVRHGVNGLVFSDSSELAQQLLHLLMGLGGIEGTEGAGDRGGSAEASGLGELVRLRSGAQEVSSWEDNWSEVMPPLLWSK